MFGTVNSFVNQSQINAGFANRLSQRDGTVPNAATCLMPNVSSVIFDDFNDLMIA